MKKLMLIMGLALIGIFGAESAGAEEQAVGGSVQEVAALAEDQTPIDQQVIKILNDNFKKLQIICLDIKNFIFFLTNSNIL